MTTYPSVDGAPTVRSLSWQIQLILAMQSMGGGSWLPFVVHVPTQTESLENTMSAFTPNRRLARFVAFMGG